MTRERGLRQYAQVRRCAAFRAGRRDIASAIADPAALPGRLRRAPEEWRGRFIEPWSRLELEYAVALDRGTPLPTPQDPDISEALDDLDGLLAEVVTSG